MKKFIAVLLCIAMIFSFSACGAESYIGNNISVSIKNNGKKKVTLNCTDLFDETYTLSYDFSSGSEEKSEDELFAVYNVKNEAGTNTYQITGCFEGEGGINIVYLNSEQSPIGRVFADVSVDARKRVTLSNVEITNGSCYSKIFATEEEDSEDISISDGSGGIKFIKLANLSGTWELGDYNYDVVLAEGPELLELSRYSQFQFEAIAAGECVAYLINKSAKTQFVITFVSENDPESVGSYILTLKDAFKADYIPETQPEEKKAYEEIKEDIPEVIDIPVDPIVVDPDDPVKKDDPEKKDEPVKKDEPAVIEEVVIDYANSDSRNTATACDMTFTYNGVKIDYRAEKGANFADVRNGIINADTPKEECIISGGGIEAEYYYMPSGFGAAVWVENNVVSRITFMNDDKTNEDFKKVLQTLLNAQAL